jgi:hypothetical protein
MNCPFRSTVVPKFVTGFLLCVLVSAAIPMSADTLTFASTNTNNSPFYVELNSTNYLAQYGITMTNVTAGTTVDVLCANASYNPGGCTSGSGALVAPPGTPNVLYQMGNSSSGVSYTLDFSTPLSSLSFYTAGQGSSNLIGAWSATAYDAGNAVVSTVGVASLSGGFAGEAPQPYTLSGPGITSVTFYGNCEGVCGVYGDAIGDLSSPDLHQTPEPGSMVLFGSGLLAMSGAIRRRTTKK